MFLVVGGGKVACRKARSLLRSEVSLLVVAKNFIDEFRDMEGERVTLYQMSAQEFFEEYEEVFDQVDFALLATDNREVNLRCSQKMKEKKILALVVDEKEESDFIMPAVLEKGTIHAAISTEGTSPVISKKIKARLEELLSDIDVEKLGWIGEVRRILVERSKRGEKQDVAKICEELSEADKAEVETYLKRIKGEEIWK